MRLILIVLIPEPCQAHNETYIKHTSHCLNIPSRETGRVTNWPLKCHSSNENDQGKEYCEQMTSFNILNARLT